MFRASRLLVTTASVLIAALLYGCGTADTVQVPAARAVAAKRPYLIANGELLHFVALRNDTLVCARVQNAPYTPQAPRYGPDDIAPPYKYELALNEIYDLPATRDSMYIPVQAIRYATERNYPPAHDVDQSASFTEVVTTIGNIVLIAALASAVLLVIIIATKKSCPFVYAWNGTGFALEGEIYSGAIHPPLERDDWLPLHGLRPVDGEWRLRLTNEVRELQYTNLTELLVYDHTIGTALLHDRYGTAWEVDSLAPPMRAIAGDRRLVTTELAAADTTLFTPTVRPDSDPMETLTLGFDRPASCDTALLVLRAKNAPLLDHTLGEFYRRFGGTWPAWRDRMRRADPADLHRWIEEQGIPVVVEVHDGTQWRRHDVFSIVGPMAFRTEAMRIPLPPGSDVPVYVRLRFGRLFWEIDQVAFCPGPRPAPAPRVVPLRSAVHRDGRDVRHELAAVDTAYHALTSVGDRVDLSFDALPPSPRHARTVVLHSRGWYEAIVDASGPAATRFLPRFQRPGRFPEFALELYQDMLRAGTTGARR